MSGADVTGSPVAERSQIMFRLVSFVIASLADVLSPGGLTRPRGWSQTVLPDGRACCISWPILLHVLYSWRSRTTMASTGIISLARALQP
jgi:hypothetical protein